ncbi:MAG: glycosyltransferase family 2 protein [Rhodospirillales bacterium]
MKHETMTARLERLARETAPRSPARAGEEIAPVRVLAKHLSAWFAAGGLWRGRRAFVCGVCDAMTPVLAALRASLEDSAPKAFNPFADPPAPRAPRARAQAPKLSAAVTARNEEHRLAACLGRLGFADEIVVLLDDCTDNSRAVADAYADTVIEGAFGLEGERRAAVMAACRGEWIVEIDADEHATDALAAEICEVIKTSPYDWHEIPVDNMIGGVLVRRGWGASYGKAAYPGLSRRGVKAWGPERVHPSLVWTAPKGKGPALQNRVTHYVDRDVADMIRRLDSYSAARARDLAGHGRISPLASDARRFVSRFIKCYIRRGGRHEGGYGFIIALMAALYPVVSSAKAQEIKEGSGG